MKKFSYVITDNEGIHARPAGQLVKLVKEFKDTDITIAKDGKVVKASKTLGVMSLGAKKGSEVEFVFEGPSEEAACEAVSAFMKENL
ncbi:MAG TPA: HPr family phosphocarrier protein [Lachnospiraceae bacterium]|nr:HPr family phosphocarrier protein [Lachnospiraceae bacterium]